MSQPTVTQIRNAIASAINSATGLRAITTRLGQINPPVVLVLPDSPVADYKVTMDGQVDYRFRVIVVVSPANDQAGQDEVDGVISTSTADSVYAALNAAYTLSGLVAFCVVENAEAYSIITFNAMDYLACTFHLWVAV